MPTKPYLNLHSCQEGISVQVTEDYQYLQNAWTGHELGRLGVRDILDYCGIFGFVNEIDEDDQTANISSLQLQDRDTGQHSDTQWFPIKVLKRIKLSPQLSPTHQSCSPEPFSLSSTDRYEVLGQLIQASSCSEQWSQLTLESPKRSYYVPDHSYHQFANSIWKVVNARFNRENFDIPFGLANLIARFARHPAKVIWSSTAYVTEYGYWESDRIKNQYIVYDLNGHRASGITLSGYNGGFLTDQNFPRIFVLQGGKSGHGPWKNISKELETKRTIHPQTFNFKRTEPWCNFIRVMFLTNHGGTKIAVKLDLQFVE